MRAAAGIIRPASARRSGRPVFFCLALAALVLALARPQGASLPALARSNSREVLVAVDVSRSMLTEDLAPNRLGRARLLIRALLDELKGERLGLMPFAGSAFLQSPLSADYEIFRTFLDELGPDMIPSGGSDFSAVLTTAAEAFSKGDADRFLIILSDGEAQDDSWRAPAEALAKRGVRILALGLGTPAGGMVPDGKEGFIKDARGAAVLSRLDATTLRELARLTGGEYRDATAFVDLPALLQETIARSRAGKFEETDATRRVELFPWFLAPALLLLALTLWREFPPVPSPRKIQVNPAATLVRAAPLLLLFLSLFTLPSSLFSAPPPAPAPAPDPLVSLVGQLASASALAPADLARLADLTATQGESARSTQKPFPDGALHDALAAVAQGRAAAPSAADWTALHKRLESLLTPPPQPPKPEDKKKSDPKDDKKSEDKNPDKKPDDSSEDKEKSDDAKDSKSDESSSPSDSKSDANSQSKPSPDPASDSGSPDSKNPSDPASPSSPPTTPDPAKAPADKPLSSLSEPPPTDEKKPGDSAKSSAPAPTPAPTPPPPDPSSLQQAGGVAAEGTPSAEDLASANPALALPRQRLENVRAGDSPARLFQLLNQSENPPDAATSAPGSPKRNW